MKRLAGMLMLMATSVVSAAGVPPGGPEARLEPKAEVAFWISGYTGADLASGNCREPKLPAVPRSGQEVRTVGKAIHVWQACNARFMNRLSGAQPLDKRISPQAFAMMTPVELEQARRHVAAVDAAVAQAAQANTTAITARHDAWHQAANQYVETVAQKTRDMLRQPREVALR